MRLVIGNFETCDLPYAISECVRMIADAMYAMDFQQISGMDFFDLSKSSRESLLNDAMKERERIGKWLIQLIK